MKRNLIFAISLAAGMFSCNRQDELAPKTTQEFYLNSTTPGTLGRVGSATDVTRTTSGGTMLMGGGTDVDAAMRWMITKAGGGDIVVLRATGTNAYNNYIYGLQTCNSVETLLINSTTLANDPAVEAKIMAAEAVFITGGNQANYVNFWKNTRVENALNYLRNTKKCVIGGTSAGCAIQGRHYYAALNGSVLSADALANPYNVDMTLGANDFLENPYLDNLITDTHFNNPVRKGRLLAFMARMNKDYGVIARGVGVEEGTAVCIEEDGTSKVFGSANAFFYRQYNLGGPETCVSGSPLTWNRTNKAVLSYRVAGTTNGTNGFNFNTFQPIGSSTFTYVWANAGTFGESAATTPPADANSGGVNTATAPSALAYSPNSLSVQAGASATSALPTIQGTTPITFSRTVSPAAAGITINANDGRISVSSSVAAGTYSVSVTATNSAGTVTFNNVYTVNVTSTPPPSGGTTPGSLGRVGSNTDVSPATTGGTLIMGGGTDVDAAMRWMITKAGGGDIVVLRASGTNAYNNYIYGLQTCNSVETLLIDSRTLANDPAVEAKIRAAEAVFIAGGDQWNYVNLWKDTKVEDAINWVRNTKKGVVGGTSAGAAILGQYYFSAQNGTVTSAEAIANPYRSTVTLGRNDFLALPYMQNLIVDTHLNNPDRRGRITTFMARMSKDFAIRPYGIGLDENTAVCIEENGASKVFGNGYAFFLRQNTTSGTPERCVSGSSLDWYRSQAAVAVYRVGGTTSGANTFNLSSWSGTGGTSLFFYVDRGTFVQR